jgi:hypothetical protein
MLKKNPRPFGPPVFSPPSRPSNRPPPQTQFRCRKCGYNAKIKQVVRLPNAPTNTHIHTAGLTPWSCPCVRQALGSYTRKGCMYWTKMYA